MKNLFIIFLLLLSDKVITREVGQTEITTEDGIEVFQNEKYYLLKKNVKIDSDEFILFADKVKIFFDKDLYDIKMIDAVGNVILDSNLYNVKASGPSLTFEVDNEEIHIVGMNSKLLTNDTDMFSDGEIKVNNINGNFLIYGPNSKMKSENIYIEGQYIDGIFFTTEDEKDIKLLNVNDENIAFVRNKDTDMYANIVKYNKETSLMELENNVKILRDGETITGDYGTLDTRTNSYKVKSRDSKKVKVIIIEKDE